MTEAQAQQIETSGIIPTNLLGEYLATKNLMKPPVTEQEEREIESRYQEARRLLEQQRGKDNADVVRSHGLKKHP